MPYFIIYIWLTCLYHFQLVYRFINRRSRVTKYYCWRSWEVEARLCQSSSKDIPTHTTCKCCHYFFSLISWDLTYLYIKGTDMHQQKLKWFLYRFECLDIIEINCSYQYHHIQLGGTTINLKYFTTIPKSHFCIIIAWHHHFNHWCFGHYLHLSPSKHEVLFQSQP